MICSLPLLFLPLEERDPFIVTSPTSTAGKLVCSLVLRLSLEDPENNLCLKLDPVSPDAGGASDGGGGGGFLFASSVYDEDDEVAAGRGTADFFGADILGGGTALVGGGVGGTGGAGGGDGGEGVMGEAPMELPWRFCLNDDEMSLRNGLLLSPDSTRVDGLEDGTGGDGVGGTGGVECEGAGICEDTLFDGFGGFDGAAEGIGGAGAEGGGGGGIEAEGSELL